MIKKIFVPLFVAVCVFTISAAGAFAQNFAADVTGKNADGSRFSAKMYMQDGNVRMEMPQGITITRADKKVVWVLMPSEQMYMEQSVTPRDSALSASGSDSGVAERKSLGSDTVNGKTVEKFQVTYNGEGGSVTLYEWKHPAFEMPVKIASVDGSWSMEYSNIQTGAQDESLFEVPVGYQKFSAFDLSSMRQLEE